MKTCKSKVGQIAIWSDFVKPKKNMATGAINYLQSNTKLEGYSQRYIGLYVAHNNDIYIGVALNKNEEKKPDHPNWFRFIIENRIFNMLTNKGNVDPESRGSTMVPMNYKDLLTKDYYAYSVLYGPLDPEYVEMAINTNHLQRQKDVDHKLRQFTEASREATE